jgi:hypothetical protein
MTEKVVQVMRLNCCMSYVQSMQDFASLMISASARQLGYAERCQRFWQISTVPLVTMFSKTERLPVKYVIRLEDKKLN